MNGRRKATLIAAPLAAMLIASPAALAAPSTTISSGPASGEYTNDNTPTFSFTSDSPSATFECRVVQSLASSVPFADCPAVFTTPPLADGMHYIEARARDASGVDPTRARRLFHVDTLAPDGRITQGPTRTRDRTPSFTIWSTELRSTMRCGIDGLPSVPCHQTQTASTATFTTPPLKPRRRPHVLQVATTDRAGNADPTPTIFTFRIIRKKKKR